MRITIPFPAPRVNRIAVSVFFFIAGITFSSWASRIPDIQHKLALSEAGLGGVLFALPVGQLISLPFSGWLIPRFGSRQILLAAAILSPSTLILLALANSVVMLSMALFLFGLILNLINIAMNTQAVGVENLYGRSIMASFHGLWSLAGFTGAAIGTLFLSAGFPPFIHFVIIAVAGILMALSVHKHTLPDKQCNEAKQPLFVKPDRQLMLLGLIAFSCMVCEGAMADWGGVYFKKIVHAPVNLTILGYVVFMGTMATGRFLGDFLVTKFGVKRILQVSGLLITSGLLTAVFFTSLIPATLGFFFVGFGVSCVVPVVYAQAGKSEKMPSALALATVSTIGFLGFLLGPPLIGFIGEAAGLQWSFAIVAMLGLGTTLLSGRLRKA